MRDRLSKINRLIISPGWTIVIGMSSSFDSEVTFGKPKKKLKRPTLRDGSSATTSLTFNEDETLDADSEHDMLQLKPSGGSSTFKTKMEPSLSFEDEEVRIGMVQRHFLQLSHNSSTCEFQLRYLVLCLTLSCSILRV